MYSLFSSQKTLITFKRVIMSEQGIFISTSTEALTWRSFPSTVSNSILTLSSITVRKSLTTSTPVEPKSDEYSVTILFFDVAIWFFQAFTGPSYLRGALSLGAIYFPLCVCGEPSSKPSPSLSALVGSEVIGNTYTSSETASNICSRADDGIPDGLRLSLYWFKPFSA